MNEYAPEALVWVWATSLKAALPAGRSHRSTVCAAVEVELLRDPSIVVSAPSFTGLGVTEMVIADVHGDVEQQVGPATSAVQHRVATFDTATIGPQQGWVTACVVPACGHTTDGRV
jgi:hypothetical protein